MAAVDQLGIVRRNPHVVQRPANRNVPNPYFFIQRAIEGNCAIRADGANILQADQA